MAWRVSEQTLSVNVRSGLQTMECSPDKVGLLQTPQVRDRLLQVRFFVTDR